MEKKQSTNSFVATLAPEMRGKLLRYLQSQEFEISTPPHTHFSAKKKGISCTLYESGKLVVQGKGKEEFIEFYLEPEILQDFSHSYKKADADLDRTGRIGIDESGKGDFFGPLCIAGVFAGEDSIEWLKEIGVCDSKKMGEAAILKAAKEIRRRCKHHIVKINPYKYNELYKKFTNLNKLLAWGHATTIEALVETTGCNKVIIDQFAGEHVVITALKRKQMDLDLTQRHRAEEDIVVAAASVLAREAFVMGMRSLSEEYGIELPKGASAATISAGRKFVSKYGLEKLPYVGKMHFKTLDSIVR